MIYDDDGVHTPFERPPYPPPQPEPIPGAPSGDEPDPGPGLDTELGQQLHPGPDGGVQPVR